MRDLIVRSRGRRRLLYRIRLGEFFWAFFHCNRPDGLGQEKPERLFQPVMCHNFCNLPTLYPA
jgi:hypothetical protein